MSDISEYGVHTKAELLFPAHLIPSLRDLRGEEWQALVDRVAALPETHPDSLAFVLMMIELDGCLKCNSNNYKFLRGCYPLRDADRAVVQGHRPGSAGALQQGQAGAEHPFAAGHPSRRTVAGGVADANAIASQADQRSCSAGFVWAKAE